MVYSDVVRAGLILPRKEKYTMKDVHRVLINSLFETKTLSENEAAFIVRCSAIYHGTEYSRNVANANRLIIKSMVG